MQATIPIMEASSRSLDAGMSILAVDPGDVMLDQTG